MAKSPNSVTQYGDPQLPKKISVKKKERGTPIKESNQELGTEGYNEQGYDPNHYVRRFPDGTQIVHAYGKNPRTSFFHCSGVKIDIFKDGTMSIINTGNKYDYNKGGSTSTTEGHSDSRGGGHSRTNTEGGTYSDTKGDSATHVAGNSASHTAGSSTTNVSGDMNMKGNKGFSLGTQDDGGQLAMSINMNNGRIQFKSKGDMEFSSSSGNIKFSGKSMSLNAADGDVSINAKNEVTLAGKTIARGADSFRDSQVPSSSTTRQKEQGIHDGHANARHTFGYKNTVKA